MKQPTDQPAPHQTLDEIADEAIGARQMLPTRTRCEELDMLLRAAIEGILPQVRDQVGQATEGSRQWYQLRRIVEDTDDILGDSLGSGLVSAAIQVGRLATAYRALAVVAP